MGLEKASRAAPAIGVATGRVTFATDRSEVHATWISGSVRVRNHARVVSGGAPAAEAGRRWRLTTISGGGSNTSTGRGADLRCRWIPGRLSRSGPTLAAARCLRATGATSCWAATGAGHRRSLCSRILLAGRWNGAIQTMRHPEQQWMAASLTALVIRPDGTRLSGESDAKLVQRFTTSGGSGAENGTISPTAFSSRCGG